MQLEIRQLELRYALLRIAEPRQRQKLLASLAAHGQQMPVTVVADVQGSSERFVLIDGYGRVAALAELSCDVVDAVMLELGEAEALLGSHRLDSQRARSALEDGWLLDELIRRHGLCLGELATRLSRSRSWVSRRLALVTILPLSVQERVREGQLGANIAEKFLVPLARANAQQCADLVTNLDGYQPSVREMKRLYIAWRRGDAEQRLRIVKHPQLFFRATEDHKPDDPVKQLLRDLRALGALSQRSERRIDEGAWKDAAVQEQVRLSKAWVHTCRSFAALKETAEPWEAADARSRHSSSDLTTSS